MSSRGPVYITSVSSQPRPSMSFFLSVFPYVPYRVLLPPDMVGMYVYTISYVNGCDDEGHGGSASRYSSS